MRPSALDTAITAPPGMSSPSPPLSRPACTVTDSLARSVAPISTISPESACASVPSVSLPAERMSMRESSPLQATAPLPSNSPPDSSVPPRVTWPAASMRTSPPAPPLWPVATSAPAVVTSTASPVAAFSVVSSTAREAMSVVSTTMCSPAVTRMAASPAPLQFTPWAPTVPPATTRPLSTTVSPPSMVTRASAPVVTSCDAACRYTLMPAALLSPLSLRPEPASCANRPAAVTPPRSVMSPLTCASPSQ